MNKKTVIIALALATAISIALEPGESEIEHNGWSRYTNSTTNLKITEPAVSRFSLERGYLRFSHQWATSFFTKMTVDIFSSDKY
ncbi:MAG: hypothetical protein ACUVUR_03880, partial [bacterium]